MNSDRIKAKQLVLIREAEAQPCPACNGPVKLINPEFRPSGFMDDVVLTSSPSCEAQCWKDDPDRYLAATPQGVVITLDNRNRWGNPPTDPGLPEKYGRPPAPPIPSVSRREFSLVSLASLGILAAVTAAIAAVLALT